MKEAAHLAALLAALGPIAMSSFTQVLARLRRVEVDEEAQTRAAAGGALGSAMLMAKKALFLR